MGRGRAAEGIVGYRESARRMPPGDERPTWRLEVGLRLPAGDLKRPPVSA